MPKNELAGKKTGVAEGTRVQSAEQEAGEGLLFSMSCSKVGNGLFSLVTC